MFVIKPQINLNGTNARDLLEQQVVAIEALRSAMSTLQAAGPNGRDYQTMPRGTIDLAVAGHVDRLKRLESVLAELEEIAEHISDQI
jgi:hypothetical protein